LRSGAEVPQDGGTSGTEIMNKLVWVVALFGALAQGCVVNQTRVAKGSALVHSAFPYAVPYDDDEKKSVLGEDWQLENYRTYKDDMSGEVVIERKDGYTSDYEFDFDDDDKGDKKETLPSPDLLFVSRKTNARIEVTTLLLDKRLADKELRVLLSNIVDSANGSRSLFIGFGRVAGGVEKRYASRLLDSSKATLQQSEGLVATIERADVDQLQLNPKARWRRSRLFLVHAPFDHYVKEGSFGSADANKPDKFHKYRVLVLVEYTNSPEDFEQQYPDLLRVLGKLHFLSDDNVMELMAPALADCANDKGKAELTLEISETGEPDYEEGTGFQQRMCVDAVYPLFHFAATGEKRKVTRAYDFSLPSKPAWLADASYAEERAAPEAAAAPPTAAVPEAPSAPAPVPAETPAPPPGPDSAPPSSPPASP
jgi:hypothetical protein